MIILKTSESINFFRLATLKSGLSLECKGMKLSRGPSCYGRIKKEFGYKGNKASVLAQFTQHIEKLIAERA